MTVLRTFSGDFVGDGDGLRVSVFNRAGVVPSLFDGTEVVVSVSKGSGVDCSTILFRSSSMICN
eukprot:CCRYP_002377-RB/>CCRYP_002377-RB protein AED:0.34 eAED:0.34 QI:2464/0.83/0.71/1/0.5/0.28/7/0/63